MLRPATGTMKLSRSAILCLVPRCNCRCIAVITRRPFTGPFCLEIVRARRHLGNRIDKTHGSRVVAGGEAVLNALQRSSRCHPTADPQWPAAANNRNRPPSYYPTNTRRRPSPRPCDCPSARACDAPLVAFAFPIRAFRAGRNRNRAAGDHRCRPKRTRRPLCTNHQHHRSVS